MPSIKHLESKYCTVSYDLIKACEGDEFRLYSWLKLWAINKHSAFPSYDTIQQDLGMARQTLNRLLKRMEKSGRLIIERQHRRNNVYDITNYDALVDSRVPKVNSTGTKSELKLVPKVNSNEEDINKEKETRGAPSGAGKEKPIVENRQQGNIVNELITLFEPINPSFASLFPRKHEREAMQWLLDKYGVEKCRATIQALPQIISKPYAPRITTPRALKENLGKLVAFVQQEKLKKTNMGIIKV